MVGRKIQLDELILSIIYPDLGPSVGLLDISKNYQENVNCPYCNWQASEKSISGNMVCSIQLMDYS